MEIFIFAITISIIWFIWSLFYPIIRLMKQPKFIKYIYTTPLKPYDSLEKSIKEQLKNIWYNITLDEILFMKFSIITFVIIGLAWKYKWTQREKFYIEKNLEFQYFFESQYEIEFSNFSEEIKNRRLDFWFKIFINNNENNDIMIDDIVNNFNDNLNNIAKILINGNLNSDNINDTLVLTILSKYVNLLNEEWVKFFQKLEFWEL